MNTWNDITTPISYSKGPQIKLRSLFDVEDVYYVSIGKKEQNIGIKENVAASTIIDYPDMAIEGYFIAYGVNGQVLQTGIKGDVLADEAAELTYQLAQPIITYFEPDIRDQNGNRIPALIGGPNYTVYFEPDGDWENSTVPTIVYAQQKTLTNNGSLKTSCKITATVKAESPYFEIMHFETGQRIKINQYFNIDEVIEIDMGKRKLEANGFDVWANTTFDSRFFKLIKGENNFFHTPAEIKIEYRERWM